MALIQDSGQKFPSPPAADRLIDTVIHVHSLICYNSRFILKLRIVYGVYSVT